eukprot:TRINITY_DN13368_c0_g3_i1.p1 TRINITY_DN13368_c0_g3~~TRINITY_DN13368_c0_g3_i1.p1  ORF type:complete len:433 (-),score=54.17 TRINITY_DN13368_c0_g3_i1:12-1310(-)
MYSWQVIKCGANFSGYLFAESPGAQLTVAVRLVLQPDNTIHDGHLFAWDGYQLVSKLSTNACTWVLDVDQGTNKVITWKRHNGLNQQWQHYVQKSGASVLMNQNLALDYDQSLDQVIVYTYHGMANQLWFFQSANDVCQVDFAALVPHAYDEASQAWIPHQKGQALSDDDKDNDTSGEILTFLTWNVWFSPFRWEERLPALFAIMEESQATFICLQEVTTHFLQSLLQCDWVRKHYVVSDISGSTVSPYGVIILCRIPQHLEGYNIYILPTQMDRKLVVAKLNIGDTQVRVGTVHLESLNNARFRVQQLQIGLDVLTSSPNAFLMGDFNFDPSFPENNSIPADYIDTWPHLHPQDIGYSMLDGGAWRPDRIIARSNDYAPHSIHIIGSDAIPGYDEYMIRCRDQVRRCRPQDIITQTPSDHFGLLAVYVRRQ